MQDKREIPRKSIYRLSLYSRCLGRLRDNKVDIVAAFDLDPARNRSRQITVPIYPAAEMETFIRAHKIKLAILAVPASAAQETANRLCQCGVQGILNFSPLILSLSEEVTANNVNLAI